MRVEREEFLNHVAAERAGMRSVKKKGKILTLRKEKRKELNHPVKRYLRKGRKITVLPGCAVKPRPKRILAVMDQIEELEKQNAVRIKQKEMAA